MENVVENGNVSEIGTESIINEIIMLLLLMTSLIAKHYFYWSLASTLSHIILSIFIINIVIQTRNYIRK